MKIAIITGGTRGDVQPYIAVARALMARGHQVTLSTHAEYDSFIRSHGVEPGPTMRGNFRELVQTDLGRAWLTSGDSPREYARCVRELFVPLQAGWCEDAEAAVEGADAVLFYVLAAGALHAAERRNLPVIVLAPWPMVPTAEVAPVPAVWLEKLPGFVKRWAGHKFLSFAFGAFNEGHHAHRGRVGLEPFLEKDIVHFAINRGTPGMHLFSEIVLRRPTDWPSRHEVVGFPFVPESTFTPPSELADFLSVGPMPIYIGFGSMTGFSPERLALVAIKAAKLAGVRAILASGWAGLTAVDAHVHVVEEIPHDWLFPRVAAVVHHGGVGTFHEGLRAGKPTVIAAFFGDQPFWGRLNEKLGTGPKTLRRKTVTAESLAASIRTALEDRYRVRAEEIGVRMRAEDGAARAAERIEHHINTFPGR